MGEGSVMIGSLLRDDCGDSPDGFRGVIVEQRLGKPAKDCRPEHQEGRHTWKSTAQGVHKAPNPFTRGWPRSA